MKNSRDFYLIFFFQFLEVKFSIHLNRHVFVMTCPENCCGMWLQKQGTRLSRKSDGALERKCVSA